MDEVLTNPELLNLVFWQINYAEATATTRALTHWRAVNHDVRDACAADERKVWFRLLHDGYEEPLKARKAKLAVDIVDDGGHPRNYIKLLYKLQRPRTFAKERTSKCLRTQFVADMIDTFHEHKAYRRRCMPPQDMPPLSEWINSTWRSVPSWVRSAYLSQFDNCEPTCVVNHPDNHLEVDADKNALGNPPTRWGAGQRIKCWEPARSGMSLPEILASMM